MIRPPRRQGEYADREIDCQEASIFYYVVIALVLELIAGHYLKKIGAELKAHRKGI
ncbi:hypothetical protein [Mesorhizobium ventifaucium]|uniref:Uncharacterized protein n=1 Tax=Mesorhizobium ventifaucium TaxID=666020 RepID=A0ABN8JMY2_9HYPH|nr:hypothetical protein [Mesorhizobium ventifaucium]CAH2399423.1 hypothetical protein MES4922_210257 [Mesorhizobium ventifaucium]